MAVQTMFRGLVWMVLFLCIAANVWMIKTNVLGVQTSRAPDTNQTTATLEREYQHWLSVVRDHPDYRDGFARLALLAYQLGDRTKAREYLDALYSLDPNFEEIRTLEALLETN